MTDEDRWAVYREGDLYARLMHTRLRVGTPLERNLPHWAWRARRLAGWRYGGWLHVGLVCSLGMRRPVGPLFIRSVQRHIAIRSEETFRRLG